VPKSINSLTYDPFVNRTKTITMSGGNNMNFSYDGTERRVYKKDIVNSVTTEILYLHDGMNAIVERNKTGTPTEYIHGPTGIIAIKTTSSMNYVIKDHLGSTRVMINTTDLPYALTTYDYSAFGTILTPPPSSAYLYTGQEWDQTSGLHNFKARMYDGELGMFYGVDPAGAFASPFSYVNNNPISSKCRQILLEYDQ
jgi:RHS repeat-associated protein